MDALALNDILAFALLAGWVQYVPAALDVGGKLGLFGGGDSRNPGYDESGRSLAVGFAHPGVDQERFRSDPFYAEGARRAAEEHAGIVGHTWNLETTDASYVSLRIEHFVNKVIQEGWKPKAISLAATGDHMPFLGNPFAQAASEAMQAGARESAARSAPSAVPFEVIAIGIVAIVLIAISFLRK
jgi:hypothetical protein